MRWELFSSLNGVSLALLGEGKEEFFLKGRCERAIRPLFNGLDCLSERLDCIAEKVYNVRVVPEKLSLVLWLFSGLVWGRHGVSAPRIFYEK